MPKLLLDEAPLVILPQLAVRIGLNEAIVLQQIHFWLHSAQTGKRNNFFKKNRWWASFSAQEWAKQFPFWSEKTVKRTFSALESKGLIVADQLSDNSWDRTNWYTIDYTQYEQMVSSTDSSENASLEEAQAEGDALGQIDPMHRDTMTLSIGTASPDATGQVGPIDGDTMTLSLRKEENRKKQLVEETTKTPSGPPSSPSLFEVDIPEPKEPVVAVAKDRELVEYLIREGVGRSAAEQLATSHPEEARRQLEFLPFITEFKTSKGAYLRRAIEAGFGPPPGWESAQKKRAQQEKKETALERQKVIQAARDNEEAQRKSRIEELKRTLRETDPKTWGELTMQAEKSLAPPIRSRPESPSYKVSVERKIEELLLSMYPV